jgi:hypothetical protein
LINIKEITRRERKGVEGDQVSVVGSQPATNSAHENAAEWRAAVKAVLESRTFAKSNKLALFLNYICTQTIEGKAKEINEQQIGIHVFGRSPLYTASDDSIVRTQARLLRQRLEEYFEHEAPHSLWIITIPKGGYIPLFEARPGTQAEGSASAIAESPRAASPEQAADHAPRIESAEAPSARQFWKIACWLGALTLILAAVYLWQAEFRPVIASDVLWSSFFHGGRRVLIVPSDDALVLYEEQTQMTVPLSDYLSGSYLNMGNPNPSTSLPLTSQWFAAHQYTSTADLKLAMRLARLQEARDAKIETRYARGLQIDDLKGANVILIGGLGANPWIGLFGERLAFEVNYDWKNHQGYVLNRRPQPGDAASYRDRVVDNTQHSYGVLAYLPGIEDEGEALLFEGTGMAGTESASDFPFNSPAFRTFASQIGANRQRVPYFEALLETTSVGGNAPEVHVLTYHLIRP